METLISVKNVDSNLYRFESTLDNPIGWWVGNFFQSNLSKQYWLMLAEIAGVKFNDFNNFNDLKDRIYCLAKRNPKLLGMVKNTRTIINRKKIFLLRGELNKKIRLRTKLIKKKKYDYVNSLELVSNRRKSSKLPTDMLRLIVNDFIGVNRGCLHCEEKKKPIDVVLSHDSAYCRFTHIDLHCTRCKSFGRSEKAWISHKTCECTYVHKYCAICSHYSVQMYHSHTTEECDMFNDLDDLDDRFDEPNDRFDEPNDRFDEPNDTDMCDDCGLKYCQCNNDW